MKYIMLLITFLFASNTFGNSSFSETRISKLIIHDSGQEVVIALEGSVTNSESCAINHQLVLKKSHALFNELYSALLSAFHGNTKFVGWVNGCHRDMPILTRLDLIK